MFIVCATCNVVGAIKVGQMKKLTLFAMICSFSTIAQAEYFVAAGLGSTSSDTEWKVESSAITVTGTDSTDSSTMIALSAGMKEATYRAYIEYNNTAYDEANISYLTANVDYIHGLTDVASLFVGGAIGVGNLTWTDEAGDELDGETASSGALGMKFGALMNVGPGDAEIGYRYYAASLETEVSDTSTLLGDYTTTMEITSTSGLYVGYNLAF